MYRGSAYKSLFANSKSSMAEKVKLETASLVVFAWKRDNGVLAVNPFRNTVLTTNKHGARASRKREKSEIKTIFTQEIKVEYSLNISFTTGIGKKPLVSLIFFWQLNLLAVFHVVLDYDNSFV